jgi:hypothetical protein
MVNVIRLVATVCGSASQSLERAKGKDEGESDGLFARAKGLLFYRVENNNPWHFTAALTGQNYRQNVRLYDRKY